MLFAILAGLLGHIVEQIAKQHICTDGGTLAQTCDILDSIKPGTTCAKAAACEPGFVCRE
jgi:hypothetical protein